MPIPFDPPPVLSENVELRSSVAASASQPQRALRALGVKMTKIGRSADFFEVEIGGQEKVTVAVDRGALVSKEALEVLVGAAYPSVRTSEHDAVLSAAAPASRISAQSVDASAPLYSTAATVFRATWRSTARLTNCVCAVSIF